MNRLTTVHRLPHRVHACGQVFEFFELPAVTHLDTGLLLCMPMQADFNVFL